MAAVASRALKIVSVIAILTVVVSLTFFSRRLGISAKTGDIAMDQMLDSNRAIGNPLQLCTNRGIAMIAAKWAAHVSERCVLNVWSCEACECEFETSAYLQRSGRLVNAVTALRAKSSLKGEVRRRSIAG
jgi:hypothetical protein